MNPSIFYHFGLTKADFAPNTFIGGVGNTINTEALLANKLNGISTSDIKLFNVDVNNNISCHISKSYRFHVDAFRNNLALTYYLDAQGYINAFGATQTSNDFSFLGATNLSFILAENSEFIGRQATQNTNIREFYMPICTYVAARDFRSTKSTTNLKIYLPIVTYLHPQAFYSSSYTGTTLFVNPVMAGDTAIVDFLSKGGTVVYVTDQTPPDDVTDISSSNITSTSFDLNFTAPSSLNGILEYDVYIDDGTNNPLQIYTRHRAISSSGGTVSGLTSGTTYKIRLRAKSSFYTKSGFSNEIEVTTL